jgi:hypothetical protein
MSEENRIEKMTRGAAPTVSIRAMLTVFNRLQENESPCAVCSMPVRRYQAPILAGHQFGHEYCFARRDLEQRAARLNDRDGHQRLADAKRQLAAVKARSTARFSR